MRRLALLAVVTALAVPPAAVVIAPAPARAQASCRAQTPQPGTPQRVAILNALRPHVEQMAGQDIEFMVDHIRVACTWARVVVRPQAPGGRGNHYETIDAVMERRNGTWRLREMACGEVDCAPAAQQYREALPNLPTALLFQP